MKRQRIGVPYAPLHWLSESVHHQCIGGHKLGAPHRPKANLVNSSDPIPVPGEKVFSLSLLHPLVAASTHFVHTIC